MPSELENTLALVALRERERFLEHRLREMERMLWSFLCLAAGKPERLEVYAMPADQDDPLWQEAVKVGQRILAALDKERK